MRLRLAVLGDSIGYGTGASRPADTLAQRLAAGLSADGLPVESRVFAVPGAQSFDLARQVAQATPWQPDVAVIVIGANDLTNRVPIKRAAAQLGQAVRALRHHGAQVVVAPTPDISSVPFIPPPMRAALRGASTQLRRAQAEAVSAEGGRVADPQARSVAGFAADRALFSADGFHPSSAGYAVIADALLPAVREAVSEIRDIERTG
ncbi:MAG: SGNH/GDSL hydrolase family protein [Frankiaceae bacterium]